MLLVAPFYYQANLGGEGSNIPHNISVWLPTLLIVGLAQLVVIRQGRIQFPKHGTLFILSAAILITAAFTSGILWYEDFIIRYSIIIVGLMFWIALFQFKLKSTHKETVLYILLASITIHAAIATLQVFDSPLIGLIIPPFAGRFAGIFQQPNVLASAMATGIAISFYLITSRFWQNSSLPRRVLVFAAIILCLSQLMVSGSRTGLLGATAALTLLFTSQSLKVLRNKSTLTTILCAIVLGMTLATHLDQYSRGMSQAVDKIERVTQDPRSEIYQVAINAFQKSPLVGHGIGSFQNQFAEAKAEFQVSGGQEIGNVRFSHPHNELLFWMVETGIFGLTGVVVALGALLLFIGSLGWSEAGSSLALILPISVHSMLELPFYLSNYHWIIYLILLWYVFSVRETHSHIVSLSLSARALVLSLTIGLTSLGSIFLTHALLAQAGIMRFIHTDGKDVYALQIGFNNLIYVDVSKFLSMGARLQNAYPTNDREFIKQFVTWGTEYVKIVPDVLLYKHLVVALDFLDEKELAKETLATALSIYPSLDIYLQLNDLLLAGEPLYVSTEISTEKPAIESP